MLGRKTEYIQSPVQSDSLFTRHDTSGGKSNRISNVSQPRSGGDVAQSAEHRTVTPLRLVGFPGAARDFSPRINFQCRLSYGVRTSPCAIACINICAHVKDAVVYVRVRWIMETLKYPACTVRWVARPCRSWLSPGKGTRISQWEKSQWDNTVVKRNTALLLFRYCGVLFSYCNISLYQKWLLCS